MAEQPIDMGDNEFDLDSSDGDDANDSGPADGGQNFQAFGVQNQDMQGLDNDDQEESREGVRICIQVLVSNILIVY